MERRTALIFSTAAAVAIAAAGFGYAANNLLTKPAQDQVGKLAAVLPVAPASRPVQIVYDEVPVEVPPAASGVPTSPAVSGEDTSEEAQPAAQNAAVASAPAPAKPSANTTTTTTAPTRTEPVEDNVNSQPTETHTTETTQPDDHALDD